MKLRKYQEEAVQVGVDYFHGKSEKPSIMVAPTAYGKSVVVSAIANLLDGNVVVIQPSKELLMQNYGKLIALGGEASIYSASVGQKKISKITYATIGSIKSLGKTFRELGFKYVIVDECHLYPPNSNSMFGGFIKDLQTKKVLGLTATPFRLQTGNDAAGYLFSKLVMLTSRSKNAGFFKEIIYAHQIQDIVKDGFWSKLEYESWDFESGALKYNSAGSDFSENSIIQEFENQDIFGRISRRIDALTDRKSILVFVPSVSIAKELSVKIPNSAVVYGDMDSKERDDTILGFKSGGIRVVINVNVLSVGFDHPEIDAIIIGRPTASLSWFYQAVGRGTRLSDKKKDCLIIDFVGNTDRFGRVENLTVEKYKSSWQIFSGDFQLTSIPITEIGTVKREVEVADVGSETITWPYGKHKGDEISKIPSGYLNWVLKEFTFNTGNMYLKEAIEAELKQRTLSDIQTIKN